MTAMMPPLLIPALSMHQWPKCFLHVELGAAVLAVLLSDTESRLAEKL